MIVLFFLKVFEKFIYVNKTIEYSKHLMGIFIFNIILINFKNHYNRGILWKSESYTV